MLILAFGVHKNFQCALAIVQEPESQKIQGKTEKPKPDSDAELEGPYELWANSQITGVKFSQKYVKMGSNQLKSS